jgi:signal transduction histidine kinase
MLRRRRSPAGCQPATSPSCFPHSTKSPESCRQPTTRSVPKSPALEGELKQANEQLERSRRLAALGEMAAGIAHEVRNPLGSIRLHARMLEQDLEDRPGERTVAGKIIAAVRGLDAVVTDVLAFSKELKVRPEPVLAGDLLTHALEEGISTDVSGAPALRVVRQDSSRPPVVGVVRGVVGAPRAGQRDQERGGGNTRRNKEPA